MSHQQRSEQADNLVGRMNAIRNVSERHVASLHSEAQRMTDWREHVRAQPLFSLAAAAFVGFSITSRLGNSRKGAASRNVKQSAGGNVSPATEAGLTSAAMAFAGSLASAALRHYVLNKVRGL